jgi:hypothetical protein
MLPGLLVDAHVASQEMTGDQQAVAFGLLAHSYNTASSVLRKLGDNGLAVIAADRAVQVARTVGEPLLLAASAYRLANLFLPAGRVVDAEEVALTAASGLESRLDASTTHVATWGGLLLTAAVAAARQGNSGEAWELVGEAKAAARRLGTDHADLHTIFGPISLAIQGVQVAAELSPQLTAFFTSAPILASSAAVNSVSAKEVGHMAPSSRFAVALKPNVAYLSLNFDAGVK